MITSNVGEQKTHPLPLVFSMPCLTGDAPIDIDIEGFFTSEGAFIIKRAMYASINLTSILHTTGYENVQAAAYNNISSHEGFVAHQVELYGSALVDPCSRWEFAMMRTRLSTWMATDLKTKTTT